MTDEKTKILERVENMLFRYLDDVCSEVEGANGRIRTHMVLDGVKDSLKSLKNIKVLGAYGNGDAKQATATATSVK